jgi:hypothetical protein
MSFVPVLWTTLTSGNALIGDQNAGITAEGGGWNEYSGFLYTAYVGCAY